MIDEKSKRQNNDQPLWTVEDVAKYLRLKPETVRLMASSRKIPSIKVGRSWKFRSMEIKDMFMSMDETKPKKSL
jgi:excisionase family DNA binding protein